MVLTYKQKFNRKYGFKKDEGHSLKEIAQITGYKLRGLKTIFERGEGAFYTNPESVRKSVSNPQHWGFSRIYAAVNPESKAHQIDKMFLIKKNNDNK